ncbi:MAG: hypothetical protein RIC35_04230 [Marinoscillum sp.]
MRNLTALMSIFFLLTIGGCDKEDDFECDKNVDMTIFGNRTCAQANPEVYRHYNANGFLIEELEIEISRSAGDFIIKVFLSEPSPNQSELTYLIMENVSYTYGNQQASIWFFNIQQTFSGNVIFTKFDRVNRIVSGSFDFYAQSLQGDYKTSGTFKDVPLN